jgi:hypothetical protein
MAELEKLPIRWAGKLQCWPRPSSLHARLHTEQKNKSKRSFCVVRPKAHDPSLFALLRDFASSLAVNPGQGEHGTNRMTPDLRSGRLPPRLQLQLNHAQMITEANRMTQVRGACLFQSICKVPLQCWRHEGLDANVRDGPSLGRGDRWQPATPRMFSGHAEGKC